MVVSVAVAPIVAVSANDVIPSAPLNSSGILSTIIAERKAIILHCKATGYPKPDIQWFHDETPLLGENNTKTLQKDDKGYLVVWNITAHNGGFYRCTAANLAGKSSAAADVKMLKPPKLEHTSRTWLFRKRITTQVAVGDNVITSNGSTILIKCQTKEKQLESVKWTKDGNAVDEEKVTVNGVLTLENIVKRDRGRYTCTLGNQLGNDSASSQLHVLDKPSIRHLGFRSVNDSRPVFQSTYAFNDSIRGVKGHHLALMCQVTGFPSPRISWLHNFHRLTPRLHYTIRERVVFDYSSGFKEEVFQNILTLNSVDDRNEGMYTCHATNSMGAVQKKTIVGVVESPRHPYTGIWVPSAWSDCSKSKCIQAKKATQTRQSNCVTIFGHAIQPSECDPILKPNPTRECITNHCHMSWETGDWTKCSHTCGNSGLQKRDVICVYTNTKERRPLKECDALTRRRPGSERACNHYHCSPEKCVDSFTYCNQIPKMEFCDIEYYKTNCCKSCVSHPN